MHPEDKMTFSEIRKYLRLMQKRYKLASNPARKIKAPERNASHHWLPPQIPYPAGELPYHQHHPKTSKKEEIYELIEELYSLPNAMPGVSEDVHETLGLPIDLPAGLLGLVTLSFDLTRPKDCRAFRFSNEVVK
ncbi:MAG: hypothetical protein DRI61_10380 [Chloroflexi bacterium]|nr:MAG: hypothetical protein DRI61_10380 [Chloroflexota bacterium]